MPDCQFLGQFLKTCHPNLYVVALDPTGVVSKCVARLPKILAGQMPDASPKYAVMRLIRAHTLAERNPQTPTLWLWCYEQDWIVPHDSNVLHWTLKFAGTEWPQPIPHGVTVECRVEFAEQAAETGT